jgi:geranylgeranyl pyrophosphate synthase
MSSFDMTTILGVPKLNSYLDKVDSLVASAIPKDNDFIYKPYSRILKSKSKRLRPSLVIAVAAAQGIAISHEIITAAASVEIVHLASLIHDDIIDNAQTRRGTPTINFKEGLPQAILIGDYLLAEAGKIAATISADAAICVDLAITELCGGQGREAADNFNVNRSINSYFKSISGKTAALFACSAKLGGLVLGLDAVFQNGLSEFGENFGIVFQLIDDLLDFISSEQLLGKPTGNDIVEGAYSYPLLVLLNGSEPSKIKPFLKPKTNNDLKPINKILFSSGAVTETIREIKKYNNQAIRSLNIFKEDNQIISNLANLPGAYFNWAMNNLVSEQYKQLIEIV